jgi:hypothetical protein
VRYVPATLLAGEPHVVVDGAPRPDTVLTLSHWPGTPTPQVLWADVSAEIVLRALARPRLLPRGVDIATIDHYDADGVISLALLTVDGLADRHGPLLVRAAHAGDFEVVSDPAAARIAFALDALRGDALAAPAERALAVLPELCAAPEALEELWGPEALSFEAGGRMLSDGAIALEERPELDLAVVRVDSAHPDAPAAGWDGAVVHRAVPYSATNCLRVATLCGRRYEVTYRYETWVRLASRCPRRRVDLAPLAAALTDLERDGAAWEFDGAGAITPGLRRADGAESTIEPERFLAEVCADLEMLDQGPPAWDPYARPVPAFPAS